MHSILKQFSLSILAYVLASNPILAQTKRPNILWVVSEDNSPLYVGAYGDPLANTPNIDRLAAKGITFEAAYTAPICAPSRSGIITGRYASSLGTQHMRSQQPLPPSVRFFPEFLREAGYYCTNNAKTDYNTSTSWEEAWDESSKTAHWRNREGDQPFFAVFNFIESHESRLLKRTPLVTDPNAVRVPAYLPDTPVIRAEIARNYDNVSRADAAIGKILRQLEEDGLFEDTIIFYYSDHGGVVAGSKRFLNEAGTRAAFVARFPEKYADLAPLPAGSKTSELVNFIDLAPTVLSIAGIPQPKQFQGRAFAGLAAEPAPKFTFNFADRMDERYNFTRAVTDGRYRYIRNYYPERPWAQFSDFLWRLSSVKEWELCFQTGIASSEQQQFFQAQEVELLYDCRKDPDNVVNLAEAPEHKGRLKQMRAALKQHILDTRDTGFIPEPIMTAMAQGASPTEFTSDPEQYPLREILGIIDSVQISRSPDTAKQIEALSKHASPIIRYWSASLSNDNAILESLLSDPNPTVRIAAAESALRIGPDHAAMAVLEEAIMQTQRPMQRHFALDAFVRLPYDPSPSLTQVIGELAASDAWGGMDYFLARLARRIVNTRNEPQFIKRLNPPEQRQASR